MPTSSSACRAALASAAARRCCKSRSSGCTSSGRPSKRSSCRCSTVSSPRRTADPVPKKKTQALSTPVADIARAILVLHRQRVILDADLAALYGVTTKRLNEQVKRNAARFPEDFMFRLSAQETEALNRSHFATGSQKHRDPRFPPFAFTEHGAIMAATVLNRPPRRRDEPLRSARIRATARAPSASPPT